MLQDEMEEQAAAQKDDERDNEQNLPPQHKSVLQFNVKSTKHTYGHVLQQCRNEYTIFVSSYFHTYVCTSMYIHIPAVLMSGHLADFNLYTSSNLTYMYVMFVVQRYVTLYIPG